MSTPVLSQRPLPSTKDWGRSGEAGSAFRGLSKGRGSERGGRGGRGSRGGGSSTRGGANNARGSKPPVPVVVTPAPPTNTAQAPSRGSSSPSRHPNRRRRSQQPTSRTAAKSGLSTDLTQRARTGPPSPIPSPTKDLPPHLAPSTPDISSFDMRHNIDALVERVRAVANRPNTPGSHIDWAGDDDESLPDLDDWGVSTSHTTDNRHEAISPILEGSLKPLPEPNDKPVLTPSNVDTPFAVEPKEKEPVPISVEVPKVELQKTNPRTERAKRSPRVPRVPASNTKSKDSNSPKQSRGSRNTAKDTSPVDERKTDSGVSVSSASSPSSKPALSMSLPDKPNVTPGTGATTQDPKLSPIHQGSVVSDKAEQGLSESIHAVSPSKGKPEESQEAEQGLSASIHAVKDSKPSSAPSHISTHFISSPPRPFNPTHNRAHTVGRPPNFGNPNGRPPRGGPHSPRGSLSNHAGHHTRAHSSPPVGPPSGRSHSSRPVLSGDAISRIARTLGGGTPLRSAGVTAKDLST